MKPLLLFSILLLIVSKSTFCQKDTIVDLKFQEVNLSKSNVVQTSNTDKIQGIGRFKIGQATVAVINEISAETGTEIKQSASLMETYGDVEYLDQRTSKIYQLIENKEDYLTDPEYSLDPSVKVYFINYYQVSGVALKKLYLYFKDNVLYKLQCDKTMELSDAVETKYGKGVLKTEKKNISCRSKLLGDFTETEESYTTNWDAHIPNIIVESYLHKYFDNKCEKKYITYFTIYDKKIETLVNNRNSSIQRERQANKEQRKKSSLKDF